METLMKRLKYHDWFFAYSDDHNVWKRGLQAEKNLQKEIKDRGCPYTLGQLRMAVQAMIVEDFKEEEPGCWYRQPRKHKHVAPAQRKDLMHHADQVQVLAWIESQDHKDKKCQME